MTNKKNDRRMSDRAHEQTHVHRNHYVDAGNTYMNIVEDRRIDRGREKERSHVASDIRAEKRGNDRRQKKERNGEK